MTQAERLRQQLLGELGTLRASLADRMVSKLRDRTPVRTGATRDAWRVAANGDVTNDRGEVLMRLNDGHSRKAPSGFIEQAIDETVVEMQREVRK